MSTDPDRIRAPGTSGWASVDVDVRRERPAAPRAGGHPGAIPGPARDRTDVYSGRYISRYIYRERLGSRAPVYINIYMYLYTYTYVYICVRIHIYMAGHTCTVTYVYVQIQTGLWRAPLS